MKVALRGLHSAVAKLATGERVTYWYAWRGGPRLKGAPGSPEFIAGYTKAHEARKTPDARSLGSLVALYRSSPEFARLAPSTAKEWGRWLARIESANIATLTLSALEDLRARVVLLRWRNQYAKTPRSADYGAQVLSRTLSWAKGQGHLKINIMEGIETLHRSNRADVIWTDADLEKFGQHATRECLRAVKLACETGLRRGDLLALTWEQVFTDRIVRRTSKTGAEVVIPLTAGAKAVLEEIGRGKGRVLLNSKGKPWTPDGLENRISLAKRASGVKLRLHDARGTFATRLRLAGFRRDDIASALGWEPERVERIMARYVDQDRIVRRMAERLANDSTK